jgi:hypothetical protein
MRKKITLPAAEISGYDVANLIDDARQILHSASYHDIGEIISACSQHQQARVKTLIDDILCNYPTVTYGLAVLFHVDADDGAHHPIMLPLPESPPHDSAVSSARWISLRSLRRTSVPFGDQRGPAIIWSGHACAAVLLLQSRVDEPPEITDEWLGDMFRAVPGRVTVVAEGPMRWTAAVEGAAAMLANVCAGGALAETPQQFLRFSDYQAMQRAGRRFYDRLHIAGLRMPR